MKQGRKLSRAVTWAAGSLALLAIAGAPVGRTVADDTNPARPADAKAQNTARNLRKAFDGLSDNDPDVREAARRALLTLNRKDLPVLRDIVKQRAPLMPCESEVLRDVVTHVYLAGANTPVEDGSRGFVGVYFDPDQETTELSVPGVEIRHRMPGCCAYRYLEDGDVVLSVGKQPTVLAVRVPREMTQAVQLYSAGETVTFEILRRGRVIQIPVVLGARPKELPSGEFIPEFLSQRLADATGYWEQTFQPVLDAAATADAK